MKIDMNIRYAVMAERKYVKYFEEIIYPKVFGVENLCLGVEPISAKK